MLQLQNGYPHMPNPSQAVLHKGKWYMPLSSRSIYESEYESSLRRFADNLFPGYWCAPFTELVESEYGGAKADLVLVDKGYRSWVIVEVELEHHSLYNHIEPQMRRLVYGRYSERHAKCIANGIEGVSITHLEMLIRTVDPQFLVVSPKVPDDWQGPLSMISVTTCAIQIFINDQDERLLVAGGSRPVSDPDEYVSVIEPDPYYPRAYRVLAPSALMGQSHIQVNYDGYLTTWKIVSASTTMLLIPNGTLSLPEGRFRLKRDGENRFWISKEGK